jgi:hypothetical protein
MVASGERFPQLGAERSGSRAVRDIIDHPYIQRYALFDRHTPTFDFLRLGDFISPLHPQKPPVADCQEALERAEDEDWSSHDGGPKGQRRHPARQAPEGFDTTYENPSPGGPLSPRSDSGVL